jgi:hypothetical protein
MTNTELITNACLGIFIHTDARRWDQLEAIFASQVLLDYLSMSGQSAAPMSPEQIITAWKQVLPGFDQTHHQISNVIVTERETDADLFCYGTATHYIADQPSVDSPAGNVWTVVGTYDFHLVLIDSNWQVDRMTFNFKYQDGNLNLPKLAGERAK